MIDHIDKLIESGLSSFKIEGRVKSEFYVATVVAAYRKAIDKYLENPKDWKADPDLREELTKVSHRAYTTGFYFGKPSGKEQHYASSSYIRNYDMVGTVAEFDEKTMTAKVVQKNRFFVGDEVEFLCPDGSFFTEKITEIKDENGIALEVANRPQSIVYIKTTEKVEKDAFMRKKREESK